MVKMDDKMFIHWSSVLFMSGNNKDSPNFDIYSFMAWANFVPSHC